MTNTTWTIVKYNMYKALFIAALPVVMAILWVIVTLIMVGLMIYLPFSSQFHRVINRKRNKIIIWQNRVAVAKAKLKFLQSLYPNNKIINRRKV